MAFVRSRWVGYIESLTMIFLGTDEEMLEDQASLDGLYNRRFQNILEQNILNGTWKSLKAESSNSDENI